ncbi:MAG: ArsR/SmtB family transcription factor [Gammaproteobacteria bacterium]
MIEYPEEQLKETVQLLRAIAHELRLQIICHLADGPMNVSDLLSATGVSQPNLSQHLAKLRMLGILNCERRSQHVFYSLADPDIKRIVTTLKSVYCPSDKT